ncbi:MAG TPA: hypothetical protein VKR32_06720 [Puia sp.]|nr:hypothetical protein [Puia sp.]
MREEKSSREQIRLLRSNNDGENRKRKETHPRHPLNFINGLATQSSGMRGVRPSFKSPRKKDLVIDVWCIE